MPQPEIEQVIGKVFEMICVKYVRKKWGHLVDNAYLYIGCA